MSPEFKYIFQLDSFQNNRNFYNRNIAASLQLTGQIFIESLLASFDQHASIKRFSPRPIPYQRQDERIDTLEPLRRYYERQYKNSKQPFSKRIYKLSYRLTNTAIVTKHKEFYADQIQSNTSGHISWKAVNSLLSKPAASTQSPFDNTALSQKLQEFFIEKLEKIFINSASLVKSLHLVIQPDVPRARFCSGMTSFHPIEETHFDFITQNISNRFHLNNTSH